MRVRILEEASAELADAIARYESIEPGLGVQFKQEAKSTVEWISGHPDLPRVRPKDYRRVNLKVFPWYIVYVIHSEVIWIVAVAHSARLPQYWISRNVPE